MVVGDKQGRVGFGLGKAGEVADAIDKGDEVAKQQMGTVSHRGATSPIRSVLWRRARSCCDQLRRGPA